MHWGRWCRWVISGSHGVPRIAMCTCGVFARNRRFSSWNSILLGSTISAGWVETTLQAAVVITRCAYRKSIGRRKPSTSSRTRRTSHALCRSTLNSSPTGTTAGGSKCTRQKQRWRCCSYKCTPTGSIPIASGTWRELASTSWAYQAWMDRLPSSRSAASRKEKTQ